MRRTSRGFTLMEMLIVVAIIAVLIAIAIPVFASQLERSREATDAANIRSQYAQVMAEALTSESDVNIDGGTFGKVKLVQTVSNWQNNTIADNLDEIADEIEGTPAPEGYAWVSIEGNVVTIHFTGGSGEEHGNSGDQTGGNSGTPISADTIVLPTTVIKLNGGSNTLKITSPVDGLQITIRAHRGGSYNSNYDSETVTLHNGENEVIINGSNNGQVSFSFPNGGVTAEEAQEIVNNITKQ